jgi:hypothetical protein
MPNGDKTDPALPTKLAQWLESDNTADVLHNLAIVNARMSNVLAEVLNLQKDIVSEVSEKIKKISELGNEIRRVKLNGIENNSEGPLGTSKEDSLRILRALKEFGIPNMDADISAASAGTGPYIVKKIWIDSITPSLQGVSESESNRSQQEGLRLQTFTSRYSQFAEQASSALQKNSQNKGTVVNNLRIAG